MLESGIAIFPAERGDARLGRVFVKYQSIFRIAERWAEADLAQVVRVYPNLEEARRQTIYLMRTRQVQLALLVLFTGCSSVVRRSSSAV